MSDVGRAKRLAALTNEIRQSLELLESSLPKQIDGWALSKKTKLPWKVLLYREALIWRIVELGRSALESFGGYRLVSGIVLTRAAVEATAALWYLCAKVASVIDSNMVGDIDEYLMRLSMGTATGWPEDSSSQPAMPRPIRIGKFLERVEKDIEGFKHQYGVLSEYTHPNWAGTVLLYSSTNKQTAITDFGQNIRGSDSAKAVGIVSLSVALKLFHAKYNRIGDLLPAFIGVCEGQLSKCKAG
jgi:hypothetical protein